MGALSMITNAPGAYGKALEAGHAAGVARQNAALADAAATDSINRGSVAAAREQQKGAAVEGEQKAVYGASGVTLAGSPSDVMRDTSYFTDVNVQTAMNNAAREAWGYRTKAQQFREQSNLDVTEGELGVASYAMGGIGGSILGGGS